jgi:hypothetical protein
MSNEGEGQRARRTLRLSPEHVVMAQNLGDGNFSEGVRTAIEVAGMANFILKSKRWDKS